jgi:hypothetical protein
MGEENLTQSRKDAKERGGPHAKAQRREGKRKRESHAKVGRREEYRKSGM